MESGISRGQMCRKKTQNLKHIILSPFPHMLKTIQCMVIMSIHCKIVKFMASKLRVQTLGWGLHYHIEKCNQSQQFFSLLQYIFISSL